MKNCIPGLLLAVVCCSAAWSGGPASGAAKPEAPGDGLAVSAQVVGQNYCHVDLESFAVRMSVKLRFVNVSDRPVILWRKIESPSIVRVAPSVEAGEAGEFEYAPNVDMFTKEAPSRPSFAESPDAKLFVVLAPGGAYKATVPSGVFGTMKPVGGRGLLARGAHVLQLGVSTWPYSSPPDEVRRLAAAWSRYGHLATGIVYSGFIPFTIPKKFKNPPCGGS